MRQAPHSQLTQRKRQRVLVAEALAASALAENELSSSTAFASLIPSLFRLPMHAACGASAQSIARDHASNCHHHAPHLLKAPNPFATHPYPTHASNANSLAAANSDAPAVSRRRSSIKSVASSVASAAVSGPDTCLHASTSHSKLHDLFHDLPRSSARRSSGKLHQEEGEAPERAARARIVHTTDILASLRVRAEHNFPRPSNSALETYGGSGRPASTTRPFTIPLSFSLSGTVPRSRATPTVSAPERVPLLGTMRTFNRCEGRLSSRMFERKVAPGTRIKLDHPNSPVKALAIAGLGANQNQNGNRRSSKQSALFLPPAEEQTQTQTQTTSLIPDGAERSTAPLQSVTLPVPEADIVISVTGTSGSAHSMRSGPNSEHSALNSKESSPALSAAAGVASESDHEPSPASLR